MDGYNKAYVRRSCSFARRKVDLSIFFSSCWSQCSCRDRDNKRSFCSCRACTIGVNYLKAWIFLLLIKIIRDRLSFRVLSFPFHVPLPAQLSFTFSVLPFPFPLPANIPRLAKIKLKNTNGSKGISTRDPSSKCAHSYHYTTCVYVNIYYSKNIYYISPEAHLLLVHNV
jgi:hypothetical protein